MAKTLYLDSISHSGPQLHMSFKYGSGLTFTTTYWYEFSLNELDERFGNSFMERIYFNCAMFEMVSLCSLDVSVIDLGKWKHLLTKKLEEAWKKLTFYGLGEWRFKNNLPSWNAPSFLSEANDESHNPLTITEINQSAECLAFCSGGKDSLVSMKYLEAAKTPFATLAYCHSIYGQAGYQHDYIGNFLKKCATSATHHRRLWIYDTFKDSPIVELVPELGISSIVRGLTQTYTSKFSALPIMLKYGYTMMTVGHERSANIGNLIWSANGESINHQWEKSAEADILIGTYIKEELISNITYFSMLGPIHDPIIFYTLTKHTKAVPYTNSCNFKKPWCLRCPKCIYVWLGYAAFLSKELVTATFGDENLFDVDDNELWYRQLLGLTGHVPFECVGQPDEVRLLFKLCSSKGYSGKTIEVFEREIAPSFNVSEVIEKLLKVYTNDIQIPQPLADSVLKHMNELATQAKQYILSQLKE